jgi:hypothetical protein
MTTPQYLLLSAILCFVVGSVCCLQTVKSGFASGHGSTTLWSFLTFTFGFGMVGSIIALAFIGLGHVH